MLKEVHLHVLDQTWLNKAKLHKERRYSNILHSSHGNYLILRHCDDIPDDQLFGAGKVLQRRVTVQTNGLDCLEAWRNDTGKKRKFMDALERPMHVQHFCREMNSHYKTF